MRRWIVLVLIVVAALANAPVAQAAHSSDTFLLIAEQENIGTAANGDSVEVTVRRGLVVRRVPRGGLRDGDVHAPRPRRQCPRSRNLDRLVAHQLRLLRVPLHPGARGRPRRRQPVWRRCEDSRDPRYAARAVPGDPDGLLHRGTDGAGEPQHAGRRRRHAQRSGHHQLQPHRRRREHLRSRLRESPAGSPPPPDLARSPAIERDGVSAIALIVGGLLNVNAQTLAPSSLFSIDHGSSFPPPAAWERTD